MATTQTPGAERGHQESVNIVLNSSKPLHRFVQGETRSLAIVILIFGCTEILMGFQLSNVAFYIPFWQGALFLISGSLSVYTTTHLSKKMVTVCLAMFVITLLGIIMSAGYRTYTLFEMIDLMIFPNPADRSTYNRYGQMVCIESMLFISALSVSAFLIFLSVLAHRALKSTATQVMFKNIIPAMTRDTTMTE